MDELQQELFKLQDLKYRNFHSKLMPGIDKENNLHMQLISDIKDYERCLAEVKRFLPYINNWATCDIPRPKCFAKHKTELLPVIKERKH